MVVVEEPAMLPPAEEQAQISPEEALRIRESTRQKADMDYAHQTANQDPKLVATLIQHWMNSNDQ
jgi:flagellar M-ring protein FliF